MLYQLSYLGKKSKWLMADGWRWSTTQPAVARAYLRSAIGKELRAGDGIRTHDLLLGKETFYH